MSKGCNRNKKSTSGLWPSAFSPGKSRDCGNKSQAMSRFYRELLKDSTVRAKELRLRHTSRYNHNYLRYERTS